MQLVPENGAIKFFDSIDMDKVYKKDGNIEGFYDVPVTITGKWISGYYKRFEMTLLAFIVINVSHNLILNSRWTSWCVREYD